MSGMALAERHLNTLLGFEHDGYPIAGHHPGAGIEERTLASSGMPRVNLRW
jgi:hypothetical protein